MRYLILLLIILVSCGPSEKDIQRMLDNAKTLYVGRIEKMQDEINTTNDLFNTLVKKRDLEKKAYLKLIAHYKAKADSIPTQDTLIIYKENNLKARKFNYWAVPNELYLKGHFKIVSPYDLVFSEISLHIHPEILLTQNKDKVWDILIDTHSEMLSMNAVDVQIQPYKEPFMDLKPSLSAWYGFLDSSIGIDASIRIWRLYPFASIYLEEENIKAQLGLEFKIW